ncbi:hypothetical protein KR505_19185 [Eubacterium callanderi]|uniref:hypothetical protein n=1 Tax=Eubacterium TaxID=1730 RepID=UPI001C2D7B1D|nr:MULTISPECIES: hypothetical protein [Eubacterium]MBV1685525.1 hypothetical protein [Eubacterium callanderi]MDO5433381.1 hypothetical protein [Eubacterium sp.]
MAETPYCLDISTRGYGPLKITQFKGPDAPSGLDRHEFVSKSSDKRDILKAAKEIYPNEQFIFGLGF